MSSIKKALATALLLLLSAKAILAGNQSANVRNKMFPATPFIENIQAWIKDHPNDDNAYVALARIHALAFGTGENIILPATNDPASHNLPTFNPTSSVEITIGRWAKTFSSTQHFTAAQAIHLKDAVAAYNIAVTINPTNLLAQYGLYEAIRSEANNARVLPPEFWGDQTLTPKEQSDCDLALKHLLDPNPKNLAASVVLLQDGLPKTGPFLSAAFAAAITAKNKPLAAQIDNILRDYFYLQALPHARTTFTLALAKENYNRDHLITSSNPDDHICVPVAEFIMDFLKVHPELAQPNEIQNIRDSIRPPSDN